MSSEASKRRVRRATLAVVAIGLALFGCEGATPRRPNVLFISIDDLRTEIGCYGSERAITPHMDALARSGARFTRAFCQATMCTPSRTSVLTGYRPDSNGVADLFTHFREVVPDVVTLPQAFKNAGYRSLSVGKIFHKPDPESWSESPWLPDRGLKYALAENRAPGRDQRGPVFERLDVPDEAYRDGLVAQRAVEFLEDPGDEPFFLAVGFFKPHLPYAAPERYWALYDAADIELATDRTYPADAPAFGRHDNFELRAHVGVPPAGPLEPELERELVRGYLACVSFVDAQVGKVLDALEANGLADDTIVVVWSDHGYYLGEHGLWAKMGNFDEVTLAPLLVRAPGTTRPGRAVTGIVELVDLYPTLCELADIELPAHLEGTSFVPLFEDPDAKWKRAAFCQQVIEGAQLMGYSVRTPRWKYVSWRFIADPTREAGRELYDLSSQAGESRNVAELPENAARLERMQQLLARGWRGALPRG